MRERHSHSPPAVVVAAAASIQRRRQPRLRHPVQLQRRHPTPTPPPAGAWYDKSQSHQFTTLASQVEHIASTGGVVTSTIAADGADQVQIAYSAAEQAYLVTLPGIGQGKLVGRELQNSAGETLAFVDFEPKSSGYTYANLAYWVSGDGTNDLKIGNLCVRDADGIRGRAAHRQRNLHGNDRRPDR